jgi:hypothetical protein
MSIQILLEKILEPLLTCFVLLIAGGVVFWVVIIAPSQRKRTLNDYINHVQRVKQNGVLAPATIVLSSTYRAMTVAGKGGFREYNFTVDVQPQDGTPPFRAQFIAWSSGDIKSGDNYPGRKIWVAYNPNNPSEAVFDHYDEEHEQALNDWKTMKERNRITDMMSECMRIRETGTDAVGEVLEIEEFDDAKDGENAVGKPVRVKLKVLPENGSAFESESYAFISLATLPKLAVGKRFQIKFGPHKPELSGLIRALD